MPSFSSDSIAELNVLAQFDLSSSQSGIKIHSDAAPELIAAVKRLFEKELVTLDDGGYLTTLGHDAAEHAQTLLTILSTKPHINS